MSDSCSLFFLVSFLQWETTSWMWVQGQTNKAGLVPSTEHMVQTPCLRETGFMREEKARAPVRNSTWHLCFHRWVFRALGGQAEALCLLMLFFFSYFY